MKSKRRNNLFWASLALPLFCLSCAYRPLVTETGYGYGTMWQISVYEKYRDDALGLISLVGSSSREVETHGTYVNGVAALNQGKEIEASLFLLPLLEKAVDLQEKTEGYFNPFLGRLTESWLDALKKGEVLEQSMIEAYLNESQNTHLVFNGNKVKKEGNALLDLGGIGKGYLLDKGIASFKEKGIETYLINAGKSSLGLGYSDDRKSPFTVTLPNSDLSFTTYDSAISTSASDEQHYEVGGKVYSHLINAKTGSALCVYDSITLVGQNAAELDALSTAFMGMDIEKIKAFCDEFACKAVILKEGKVLYDSIGVK